MLLESGACRFSVDRQAYRLVSRCQYPDFVLGVGVWPNLVHRRMISALAQLIQAHRLDTALDRVDLQMNPVPGHRGTIGYSRFQPDPNELSTGTLKCMVEQSLDRRIADGAGGIHLGRHSPGGGH